MSSEQQAMTGRERFLRFLLSGGVAAAVNWLSRILFSQWLDYGTAVTLAFFCGMRTGFVLFRLSIAAALAAGVSQNSNTN